MPKKKYLYFLAAIIFCLTTTLHSVAQRVPYSLQAADFAINHFNDKTISGNNDLLLNSILNVWQQTGEKKYFQFVQSKVDSFLKNDPGIPAENFLSPALNLSASFYLYQITTNKKYWNEQQWRKLFQFGNNEPSQISMHMVPMAGEYAVLMHNDSLPTQIEQFIKYSCGENYNTITLINGRTLPAIIDLIEKLPAPSSHQKTLKQFARDYLKRYKKYIQQAKPDERNEVAMSTVYSILKGARLKIFDVAETKYAKELYQNEIKYFVKNDQLDLQKKRFDAGLISDLIFASAEMETQSTLDFGKGKTILLDGYFNHETTKDITGKTVQTHYLWSQFDNGGYSMFGNIFNRYGVKTELLTEAVTKEKLKNADIYFIIDPDWPKENPSPNYIMPEHIRAIEEWVKAGGVLMLFSNDSGNVEFTHYNQLAERFGIHFNENNPRNLVKGDDFPAGTIDVPLDHEIFKTAKNIYIKEICTIGLKEPASAVLTDKGDNIIAVSKVGKGTVFAIGDPWLYNEYLDGRKLPSYLENYKAAEDLVKWLISQTRK